MIPLKRILHPTDFSDCAQGALTYALQLAVRSGAELHVLHVRAGEAVLAAPADLMQPTEVNLDIRVREAVNVQLGRFDQAAVDGLHIEYSFGQDVAAAPAIIRYADMHTIDLIVIGTHGRRGFRRLLLGSVASEVLHEGHCNVMTVRLCKEQGAALEWGHRVLVPLDLSDASASILREAGAIAELLGGRLSLLHVIDADLLPVTSVKQAETMERPLPNIRQVVQERLVHLLEETGRTEADADILVEVGSPALVIIDAVKKQANDVIVMADRGQHAARFFSLGSTTERVVRSASCPVWIMKASASETMQATALPEDGQSQPAI